MNRLILSANFESTVNDVLGHANFREIAIFKSLYVFITVNLYGDNNAHPCYNYRNKFWDSSFKIKHVFSYLLVRVTEEICLNFSYKV